jgi:hypothetical protein
MSKIRHQNIPSHDQVIAVTRQWLERAVIGLNLCPFAKGVHVKGYDTTDSPRCA